MTTFAIWLSFLTMLLSVVGRVYCIGWKDQTPEGRIADVLLMGLYSAGAYGMWLLL